MMELFSLGADRGAYTEDDVREMARALTGWTADWTQSSGLQNFRFDASRHDDARQDGLRADGQLELRRRGPPVRAPIRCTRRSSSPSCGATSSPTPPDEATLASLQGLYVGSGYSIRAVRRGDPPAPRLPRRARAGDAAGRLQRRAAARDRPPDRHDRLGVAVRGRRPAAVLPAERLGLGLHALARHLDREGALGTSPATSTAKTYPNPWPANGAAAPTARPRNPPRRSRERTRLLGTTRAVGRIAAVHRGLRAVVPAGVATARVAAEPLPRDAPERAAHADRDLPRHAGELSDGRELLVQRLHPLAAAARGRRPAPAAACRRSSRACRCRPARGMDRRTSCCARPGRCCRSTAPRRSRRASSRRASPQAAAAAPPNQPVLVSIFMEGGWDALSVLAPVGKPRYHEAAPDARHAPKANGAAVHRGRDA